MKRERMPLLIDGSFTISNLLLPNGQTESDLRYYIYGNYIDEVLVMTDLDNTDGTPAGDYYYGHDHLYSTAVLFNDLGNIVERYEYDAYGKTTIWNSGFSATYATSQVGNPYTFTGRELDTLDAGSCTLFYYRARTYDPATGRFMQRDPLEIDPAGGEENLFDIYRQYTDGMSLYEYVKNNPLILVDPLGLACYYLI